MNEGRDEKGRFISGRSGNPKGRPVGARNRASLVVETMLAGAAEQIIATLIRQAVDYHELGALKMCVDRLLAPCRRTVRLSSRQIRPGDAIGAAEALADIYEAATQGEITPAEAESFANIVMRQVDLAGYQDLQKRVIELEGLLRKDEGLAVTRSDGFKKRGEQV